MNDAANSDGEALDPLATVLDVDAIPAPFDAKDWQIRVGTVGDGLQRTIAAPPQSLPALAKTLELIGVDAISRVEAAVDIAPASGKTGRMSGTMTLHATLQQTCVVTLERMDVAIEETVPAEFWPPRQIERWDAERGREAEVDDDTPDPLPIVDDRLHIGALAYETLVVAIDPHPRAADADFGEISTESEEERAAAHPFAALAQLAGKTDTLN
ncbi:MAG: YceD family protein [Pseudomonadota bacterium]